MKIGQKVRFLNEIGGGIVAGFQGKNIVLVEDDDGFQIPMPLKEVVAVETDDYNISKVHTEATKQFSPQPIKTHADASAATEREPADDPVTFRYPVEERKGGDVLSAYMAFVPIDIKEVTNTRFEAYFVNDCNYFLHFAYFTAVGTSWQLHATAEVEPNTKLFIEEFGRETLNDMEKLRVQIIAYKRDKGFLAKPPVDVQLRMDPVKFYKLHTFAENDFFESPALIHTLVENDTVPRPLNVNPQQLKEKMLAKEHTRIERQPSRRPSSRRQHDNVIVVDLHAHDLLETTAGMSAADILNYQLDVFRKTLDENKTKKGQKIVFIHGKGEGVLRHAVIHELNYRYKAYTYQDASFQEYGYGATQVTIR